MIPGKHAGSRSKKESLSAAVQTTDRYSIKRYLTDLEAVSSAYDIVCNPCKKDHIAQAGAASSSFQSRFCGPQGETIASLSGCLSTHRFLIANLKQHITQTHTGFCEYCKEKLGDNMYKQALRENCLTHNKISPKSVEGVEALRQYHEGGDRCSRTVDHSAKAAKDVVLLNKKQRERWNAGLKGRRDPNREDREKTFSDLSYDHICDLVSADSGYGTSVAEISGRHEDVEPQRDIPAASSGSTEEYVVGVGDGNRQLIPNTEYPPEITEGGEMEEFWIDWNGGGGDCGPELSLTCRRDSGAG